MDFFRFKVLNIYTSIPLSTMEEILKKSFVREFAPYGSRVVGCAKEDSDYDYIVYCTARPTSADMEDTGFEPDSTDPLYGDDFSSWRKGKVNLVFTDKYSFYKASLEACEFCKEYRVWDKEDRCKVHKAFRALAAQEEPVLCF